MNITVYLGATEGNDPALITAVKALGTWIGSNGHSLVYGGSRCGLMGMLAQSVLESGGHVTGVEPRFFVEAGFVYDAIDELIVTETMRERKATMIERGDAFIAFPGGTGTLEEILYDLNGYYEGMRILLKRMLDTELSTPEKLRGIRFAASLDEIAAILDGDR